MQGITGPEKVFEGNKGFKETIAGDFQIDWEKEDLERVTKTIIKKFNAEIHSQSTLEGLQDLMIEYSFDVNEIKNITLNTFNVAYNIIGGGEEGSKKNISTKEEADHSLPYMMSALLLDGNLLPAQYLPARILKDDVQQLLQKVHVYEKTDYSLLFPREMACDINILFKNGSQLRTAKKDYEGFLTRPASWEFIIEKFNHLSASFADESLREEIVSLVKDLENHKISELMELLEKVNSSVLIY